MIRLTPLCLTIVLLFSARLAGQQYHTYVGSLGDGHAVLAWGHTGGRNTIGRSSQSLGKAVVKAAGRTIEVTGRNWVELKDLEPDREHTYEVLLGTQKIGAGKFRTWAKQADKLCFFVIGDWGNGGSGQFLVAEAMWKEYERRAGGEYPVRFVLSTGDNIYGRLGFTLRFGDSGDSDDDWEQKFFKPYAPLIAQIPFYATIGNHDGNETERRGDLAAYLDNFFFPAGAPARYYRFSYGGLADFFALDTSLNTEKGPLKPMYRPGGDQHKWLMKNLAESEVLWKLPYFHHPPFNAGPRHIASARELNHFMDLFGIHEVQAAFSGHEHNFQFSALNERTRRIRYVVSGSGGELRSGNVRSSMEQAQIEGWSGQYHFLAVELDRNEMRIQPLSFEPVNVVDRSGKRIEMPLRIKSGQGILPSLTGAKSN